MFVTVVEHYSKRDEFDIFIPSLVSGKNAYVASNEATKNNVANNIRNKRYCVVRVIIVRVNLDGMNEYHCFDRHGDHFIITDLDNTVRNDHRLVHWIETLDCNIRNGINRSFKEIRVFVNQHGVDDYTLLNLDKEQVDFHDRVRARTKRYFE